MSGQGASGGGGNGGKRKEWRRSGYLKMKKKKFMAKWCVRSRRIPAARPVTVALFRCPRSNAAFCCSGFLHALFQSRYKRFCTVDEGRLLYYDAFFEKSEENEPRGEIMLEAGDRVVVEPSGVIQFSIKTLDGSAYIFEPESDTDQAYWLAALHESMLSPEELTRLYGATYATLGYKEARKEKKAKSKAALEKLRQDSDKPKVLTLTVPEGKQGGDSMSIVRGGKRMTLTIPLGL
jgi:hypothetical protein